MSAGDDTKSVSTPAFAIAARTRSQRDRYSRSGKGGGSSFFSRSEIVRNTSCLRSLIPVPP
jgi:hypothetical protein